MTCTMYIDVIDTLTYFHSKKFFFDSCITLLCDKCKNCYVPNIHTNINPSLIFLIAYVFKYYKL